MPSFYRVAKRFPPGDDEYLTRRDKGRQPRPNATSEEVRTWNALSAFATEEGVRRAGRRYPEQLGRLIVRYDIPERSSLRWEPTFGPGHYSLWGDFQELKRYLVLDFQATI